jgi:phenylpropionate dioxygenase-like ring-hydroxylating dioxygenase large terminal subunit
MSEPQLIAPQFTGDMPVGLPPWTYRSAELLELEYERVILPSWQFVCHVNQVKSPGDFATLDMRRDSVIVIRGADGELRAFANFCRHRGTKLLDGSGTCRNRIVCPYHGWSYDLSGAMVAAPSPETFPGLDKNNLGLRPVEMEILLGLVFVRVIGGGLGLKEIWGDAVRHLEPFGIESFEPAGPPNAQVWNANWKVAIDNNLENYHVPMGHPGYHRLLDLDDANGFMNQHGVAGSMATVRQRLSSNWSERRYQKLAPHALADLPEKLRKTWSFTIMPPNFGLDIYPDSMDIFQILPLGAETCQVRYPLYVRPGSSREQEVLRYLNWRINRQVTAEDRELSERVQMGMGSHGYEPGPLSTHEICLKDFHDRIRAACPVTLLANSPPAGQMRQINARMATRH